MVAETEVVAWAAAWAAAVACEAAAVACEVAAVADSLVGAVAAAAGNLVGADYRTLALEAPIWAARRRHAWLQLLLRLLWNPLSRHRLAEARVTGPSLPFCE